MEKRRIAIIGRQRSGTTVFRQLVGSSDNSFDLGEVFHTRVDLATNFWGFLFSMARDDQSCMHPSNWKFAWDAFIAEQHTAFSADVLVFDLKFEYFPLTFRHYGREARFFFEDPHTFYIYLRRLNTAAQIISSRLASETHKWLEINHENPRAALRIGKILIKKIPDSEDIETIHPDIETIHIDPDILIDEIQAIQQEDESFIGLISSHLDVVCIEYESLFDESGNFNMSVIEKISEISGIEPGAFSKVPALKRQSTGNCLEKISNRDEIKNRFSGTKFEWMIL